MTRWDGLNRRKFPRVNYPCLVVVRKDKDTSEVILTHTENIGIGGVCFTLKQNIKLFERVDLEIDLLDLGEHIRCKGKVVWNVQRKSNEKKKPLFYDTGIEFDDISVREQERLKEIVERLAKSQKM